MKMKKAIRMPLRRAPGRRPPAAPLRARAATAEEAYEEEDYDEGEEPNMKFSHALIVVLVLHLVAVGGVFAFNWMKAKQTAESKAPKAAALASSVPAEKAASAPASTAAAKPATIEGWNGKTHTVAAGDTLTRIASTHGTTIEAIEKENGITTYSMIRVGQVLKIPGSEKSSSTAKTETAPAKPAASSSSAAMKQAFIATKTETTSVKPTATVVKSAPATIAAVPKTKAVESSAKPEQPKASPAPAAATPDTYVVASGDNPYTIAKKLHVSYNELVALNGITDPTKIQIGQKLKVPKKN